MRRLQRVGAGENQVLFFYPLGNISKKNVIRDVLDFFFSLYFPPPRTVVTSSSAAAGYAEERQQQAGAAVKKAETTSWKFAKKVVLAGGLSRSPLVWIATAQRSPLSNLPLWTRNVFSREANLGRKRIRGRSFMALSNEYLLLGPRISMLSVAPTCCIRCL